MWWIVHIVSVIVFCFSARQFLRASTEGLRWDRLELYSHRALRMEKTYRVFAWGIMTFIWIYLCFFSFLNSAGF